MIGYDKAQSLLAAAICPLGQEEVPLAEAHGRVLAEPVHAAVASPRRDVSAMDGYALRDADAHIGARFRVMGQSFAGGCPPPATGAGEAVRIFTGAPVPKGADRAVMQENCTAESGGMTITGEYGPGWHVRKAGSDFAEGDRLLSAGRVLDPRAIVALAAADRASTMVYRPPQVTIVATGDELVQPGAARDDPRAIPESVSFGVAALAIQHGARIVGRFAGADDLTELRRLADVALTAADVVIVTGGASVGERDFAKAMFAGDGLDLVFSKVAIKPGKPVWMGRARGRWIVGLPGNPTSAMVTARLFLAPLLVGLGGRRPEEALEWRKMPLAAAVPEAGARTSFIRMRREEGRLVPVANTDSSAQAALVEAGWLGRRDANAPALAPGDTIEALRF